MDASTPLNAAVLRLAHCSHAPAGRLAAATAALYVVCFPLGALAALITDPALRWRLAADRPIAAASTNAPSAPVDDTAVFEHMNPLSVVGKSPKAQPADLVDVRVASPPCSTDDDALAPFLAEYKPCAWWFKLTDLGAGVYV